MAKTLKLLKNSNELLNKLFTKLNLEIPTALTNLSFYKEIENFKDAEYIYSIAYEMLIRTDEYQSLLEEYEPLKNKSKYDMSNEEFSKFRDLGDRMNNLGLNKTSFLGFDYDNYTDHVFKRIEYYNEVLNSSFNVRFFHKLKLELSENIFYLLAKFYLEKGKLYRYLDYYYHPIPIPIPISERKLVIEDLKNKSELKTKDGYNNFLTLLNKYYIPCVDELTAEIKYKSLSSETIYLKELDKDFLSFLIEKKNQNLLIPTKSDVTKSNVSFWFKNSINEIKGGLNKLIDFYKETNSIYDQKGRYSDKSKNEILNNLSDFYIPCVNRLENSVEIPFLKESNLNGDNTFIKRLEYAGFKSITREKGDMLLNVEYYNCFLVQLSDYISLSLLEETFLEELAYTDLKNRYIDTEPLFSRPRLMFDEARLRNIPVNLNLSKEDLLLYISQIKDEYDIDNHIVKTDIEYFFELELESNKAEMPINIKLVDEIKRRKRHNVSNRNELKKDFAMAFYIYDIYKVLLPHKEKLEDDILTEIRNLFDYDTSIESSMELLDEKIKTYLNIMKEFIHGVNKDDENNSLKLKYYENHNYGPKYKNLIIGKSYIAKSNFPELKKNLGF